MARHGTRTAYVAGCRCPECTRANREYANRHNRRRAHIAAGAAEPSQIPAGPVRQHLRRLLAEGIGQRVIAARTGVARSTIRALLGAGRPPRQLVYRDTAERIFALDPETIRLPGGAMLPAGETVRRIREMRAFGWAWQQVGEAIGMTGSNAHAMLSRRRVRVSTAHRVAAAHRAARAAHAQHRTA